MAQKIIQMQMKHLYFNLKDLFSNRKGFVILTSLLRFKNKSLEFREYQLLSAASLRSITAFQVQMNLTFMRYRNAVYGNFFAGRQRNAIVVEYKANLNT